MATRLLVVCLGGAAGAGARYLVTLVAARALGAAFPYGTLVVNLTGCFLMGLIAELSVTTTWIPPVLRLALTTGVLGGLTTYSSFNYETTALAASRAYGAAGLNTALTIGGSLAAGLLGMALARRLVGGG